MKTDQLTVTELQVTKAIANMNRVLSQTIITSASGVTPAQGMRGNVKNILSDINSLEEVLNSIQDAAAAKAKADEAATKKASPVKEQLKNTPTANKAEGDDTPVVAKA